jgi:hypothetical protein
VFSIGVLLRASLVTVLTRAIAQAHGTLRHARGGRRTAPQWCSTCSASHGPLPSLVVSLNFNLSPGRCCVCGAWHVCFAWEEELETGTFRYAWTQGFGRRRWALAKLAAIAVVLAAATAAFGALVSWYYQPYFTASDPALGLVQNSPLATLFSLREVTCPAWTLPAFAIGALAGMLIRRAVPAIIATLAAYAGLTVATDGFLRGHYLAPLTTTSLNLPGTV